MAYDEQLADRIRRSLSEIPDLAEIRMMGGLAFMVNGKMCLGVLRDELMCRIDPAMYEVLIEEPGCREMDFTGRPMKGLVMVDSSAIRTPQQLNRWVSLALEFNPGAKSSKKKG